MGGGREEGGCFLDRMPAARGVGGKNFFATLELSGKRIGAGTLKKIFKVGYVAKLRNASLLSYSNREML